MFNKGFRLPFNRTTLELKQQKAILAKKSIGTFNRTTLELKLIQVFYARFRMLLLIAPHWN